MGAFSSAFSSAFSKDTPGTTLYVIDPVRASGGSFVQEPTSGTAAVTESLTETTITLLPSTLSESIGQAPSVTETLGKTTITLSVTTLSETVGNPPSIYEVLPVATVTLQPSISENLSPAPIEATITNTLPGLSQSASATAQPVYTAQGYTLLPTMRQSVQTESQSFYDAAVTNTLPGLSQSTTAELALPNAVIQQTLPSLQQSASTAIKNVKALRVSQTLPGLSQSNTTLWRKQMEVYFSGDVDMQVSISYTPRRRRVQWYESGLEMRS